MKKTKIIVPALGIIAFATAASITGTVAWFTANNAVSVTGMQFKTQVGNNLLIADNQNSSFTDAFFGTSLTQTRKAKLEPVSSVDGVGFYYTTVANDNGSAKEASPFYTYNEGAALVDTDADKTANDASFNTRYGVASPTTGWAGTVLYGYVDYTFYLKASLSTTGDRIIMNECTMRYNGAGLGASDKAWRIGVYAAPAIASTNDGVTTVTPYETPMAAGNNKTILSPTGADYFTKTEGGEPAIVDAVNGVSGTVRGDGFAPTYGDVINFNKKAIIYSAQTNAETNKVFKVVVRLWLEGEDTKCYVDNYKTLSADYTLSLSFVTELNTVDEGSSAGVSNIG